MEDLAKEKYSRFRDDVIQTTETKGFIVFPAEKIPEHLIREKWNTKLLVLLPVTHHQIADIFLFEGHTNRIVKDKDLWYIYIIED